MSRLKVSLVTGLVVLGGAAATASSAPAQPPENASCLGVLSSAAGQAGLRNTVAPAPGQDVAALAQEHGSFEFCFALFLAGGGG